MKLFILLFLSANLIAIGHGGESHSGMQITLGNAWDGKTVPAGQQCQKFGGNNPKTPEMHIHGVPDGTDKLVLEFSDRSYKKMDNGGHGKIAYLLNQDNFHGNVYVPSVSGHSFDLPKGFKLIAEHRSPKWDKAGAYMPPCSGGKGNSYYATVKAMSGNKVLNSTIVELGKY
jgi:hypothetical protein